MRGVHAPRARLPTAAALVSNVPQRTGKGTQPHGSPRCYRGRPRPPLVLPGSRPRSQLSSPSCAWRGWACSRHLQGRSRQHRPPDPALQAPSTPPGLTLHRVEHLHGVDEVGAGVEVVGPRLLQPPEAEEDAVGRGAGGESAAAGHAGVARPAPRLQVEGLEGGDGQLALPAPCTWMRFWGCRHPEGQPAPPARPSCSAVVQHARRELGVCRGLRGKSPPSTGAALRGARLAHLPSRKILLPCRKADAP